MYSGAGGGEKSLHSAFHQQHKPEQLGHTNMLKWANWDTWRLFHFGWASARGFSPSISLLNKHTQMLYDFVRNNTFPGNLTMTLGLETWPVSQLVAFHMVQRRTKTCHDKTMTVLVVTMMEMRSYLKKQNCPLVTYDVDNLKMKCCYQMTRRPITC